MYTPPAESFENEEEAGKAAGKSIWSEPGCHFFFLRDFFSVSIFRSTSFFFNYCIVFLKVP